MNVADVTIHIDKTLDHDKRAEIVALLSDHAGVSEIIHHDEKPHLMVIKYDPQSVTSHELLEIVLATGGHAELIGL